MKSLRSLVMSAVAPSLLLCTAAHADLTPIGPEFRIKAPESFAEGMTTSGTVLGIFGQTQGQFFAKDGTPASDPFTIAWDTQDSAYTTAPQYVLAPDGHLALAWVDKPAASNVIYDYRVRFQLFNADGSAQGPAVTVVEQEVTSPLMMISEPSLDLAMNAQGDFVVTWSDIRGLQTVKKAGRATLYAEVYNADGTPATNAITVTSTPLIGALHNIGLVFEPTAGIDAAGNFAVAWSAFQTNNGSGYHQGSYAQAYNAAGLAQGTAIELAPGSNDCCVYHVDALANGDFAISRLTGSYGKTLVVQKLTPAGALDGRGAILLSPDASQGDASPYFSIVDAVVDADGYWTVAFGTWPNDPNESEDLLLRRDSLLRFTPDGKAIGSPVILEPAAESWGDTALLYALPDHQVLALYNTFLLDPNNPNKTLGSAFTAGQLFLTR